MTSRLDSAVGQLEAFLPGITVDEIEHSRGILTATVSCRGRNFQVSHKLEDLRKIYLVAPEMLAEVEDFMFREGML